MQRPLQMQRFFLFVNLPTQNYFEVGCFFRFRLPGFGQEVAVWVTFAVYLVITHIFPIIPITPTKRINLPTIPAFLSIYALFFRRYRGVLRNLDLYL